MFDAPAYLAALERPTFIDLNGKKRVGVMIGADTYVALHAYMRSRAFNPDGTLNRAGFIAAQRRIVTTMFPSPHWWQIWRFREWLAKPVVWHVFQLPEDGRTKAIWDFMRSLATALGRTLNPPAPGTIRQASIAKAADSPSASPISGSSPDSTAPTPVSTTPGPDDLGAQTTAPSPTSST